MFDIDYRKEFTVWWESFRSSSHPVIEEMKNTVEDSPHHREENVYVHTSMVVDEYIKATDHRTSGKWLYEDMQGAIASVFHDFGKPDSEEELYSDKYEAVIRRYTGHEVISSSYWMDFWVKNEHNIQGIVEDRHAAYNIMVMVCYHLPYQFSNDRMRILRTHLNHYGIFDAFITLLESDARGRTPDDPESTLERCLSWIESLKSTQPLDMVKKDSVVHVAIGCSASGKSHYFKDWQTFSFDRVRMDMFPRELYSESFNAFLEFFENDARDMTPFVKMYGVGKPKVKYGELEWLLLILKNEYKNRNVDLPFVVDNTSLSPRSRRRIESIVKDSDMHAVFFMSSLDDLISNDKLRHPEKSVGSEVIKKQYFRIFPPMIGEVSDISVKITKRY